MDSLEIKVDKWTFRVPRNLLYNENDFWVRKVGNVATVGITDFLQNASGDIIFANTPTPGTKIEQFDEAGSYESAKITIDVISPVSGAVIGGNPELETAPELANTDPYGKGWFLQIELSNFESDRENLVDAEAYFESMKRKIEKEREKLKQRLAKT